MGVEERESNGKIMLNWSLFNILHLNAPIAFEAMCYFLFCEQFNQPYGIFRYKNQAGIETEPIEYEGVLLHPIMYGDIFQFNNYIQALIYDPLDYPVDEYAVLSIRLKNIILN